MQNTKIVIMTENASVSVNLTGKRNFMHLARKSDNYKGDEDHKQLLIDMLWSHYGIAAIRAEPFKTLLGKHRIPDVRSTNYPGETLYFELDGEYHGFGDELTTSDYTYRKQQDYKDLGYHLITINKAVTDGYDADLMKVILESHNLQDLRTK